MAVPRGWRRFSALVFLATAGCSSGVSGLRALPAGAPQVAPFPEVAAHRPAFRMRPAAAHIIKTTNWVVAKGTTQRVSGTLAVFASQAIEIDGTLSIEPGASVGLIANGSLTIAGRVVSTDGNAHAPSSAILGGSSVSVTGATHWPGDVAIVTNGAGTVAIDNDLTVAKGANGTSAAKADSPGGAQSGGSVWIGTRDANDATYRWIGQYDPRLKNFNATSPQLLTIRQRVVAGDGGDGYSDVNGTKRGTSQVLVAGDGANGGNVSLRARRTTLGKSLVSGGNGGNGGNSGFDSTGAHFKVAMDGKMPHQAGRALVATLGNGGTAGSVSTSGFVVGTPSTHSSGGNAGDLSFARAGNGGPGGAGGTTTITLGAVGWGPIKGAESYVHLDAGGNGGAATNANAPGGAGGWIQFTNGSSSGTVSLDAAQSSISHYANGGAGFSGCPTETVGTNGGNGGDFYVPKKLFGHIRASFDGGNGGSGIGPIGFGGSAGSDFSNRGIGNAGDDGSPCTSDFAFAPIFNHGSPYIQEYALDTNWVPHPTRTFGAGNYDFWIYGVADPINAYYYAASFGGGLEAYSIDGTGKASLVKQQSITASSEDGVSITTDGSYVYAVSYYYDSISIVKAGPTLSPVATLYPDVSPGALILDSANAYLTTEPGSVGGNQMLEYARNPDGTLTAVSNTQTYSNTITALADTGTSVYVATSANSGNPVVYQYSTGAGGTTPLSVPSFSVPTSGVGISDIACTKSLCFMLASGTIWQFSIGSDGSLTPLATPEVFITSGSRWVSLDPSKTRLYSGSPGYGVEGWTVTPTGISPLFPNTPLANEPGTFGFLYFPNPYASERRPRK